jgi:hypothetical protein
MKYALGNMLNGAGGLNADGLSLDLQFAADKTLTARKGPTPVFTRGSSATQVGATGLIEYAPENLALQSENFGTTWSNSTGNALTLNDSLSPIGTLTADRIDFPATAATGLVRTLTQNFGSTVAGNGPVTASVWLRTVSGASTVYLTLLDGGPPWQRVHVACNVTTEWTRFSVTLNTPAISLFLLIGPDTRTTTGTPAQPSVQDAASVYAWGAQLERHSSVRTYIPTTTAAVYAARFDHDPLTLACKGLLIEESRTNLILQSDNFASASWVKTVCVVSSNVSTAPDGSGNADKLVTDSGSTQGRVTQTITLTGSHVYSVFAKASEWGWISIFPLSSAGGVWFNLTNGTIGTQQSGFVGSITSFGDGWYRCSVQCTGIGASTTARIISTNANGVQSTGDGTSGIFIWGAQLEAGAFPTSYIPTVASSVVRSADVCSITGSDFSGFWNRFAGTCVIGVGSSVAGGGRFISNNSGARALELFHNSGLTGIDFFEAAGVNEIRVITAPIFPVKLGLAYAINDYQSSANGILGGVDTNTGGTIPDPNALHIGNLGGSAPRLTGHIQSVRYFKKRLSNAKLQTLTV